MIVPDGREILLWPRTDRELEERILRFPPSLLRDRQRGGSTSEEATPPTTTSARDNSDCRGREALGFLRLPIALGNEITSSDLLISAARGLLSELLMVRAKQQNEKRVTELTNVSDDETNAPIAPNSESTAICSKVEGQGEEQQQCQRIRVTIVNPSDTPQPSIEEGEEGGEIGGGPQHEPSEGDLVVEVQTHQSKEEGRRGNEDTPSEAQHTIVEREGHLSSPALALLTPPAVCQRSAQRKAAIVKSETVVVRNSDLHIPRPPIKIMGAPVESFIYGYEVRNNLLVVEGSTVANGGQGGEESTQSSEQEEVQENTQRQHSEPSQSKKVVEEEEEQQQHQTRRPKHFYINTQTLVSSPEIMEDARDRKALQYVLDLERRTRRTRNREERLRAGHEAQLIAIEAQRQAERDEQMCFLLAVLFAVPFGFQKVFRPVMDRLFFERQLSRLCGPLFLLFIRRKKREILIKRLTHAARLSPSTRLDLACFSSSSSSSSSPQLHDYAASAKEVVNVTADELEEYCQSARGGVGSGGDGEGSLVPRSTSGASLLFSAGRRIIATAGGNFVSPCVAALPLLAAETRRPAGSHLYPSTDRGGVNHATNASNKEECHGPSTAIGYRLVPSRVAQSQQGSLREHASPNGDSPVVVESNPCSASCISLLPFPTVRVPLQCPSERLLSRWPSYALEALLSMATPRYYFAGEMLFYDDALRNEGSSEDDTSDGDDEKEGNNKMRNARDSRRRRKRSSDASTSATRGADSRLTDQGGPAKERRRSSAVLSGANSSASRKEIKNNSSPHKIDSAATGGDLLNTYTTIHGGEEDLWGARARERAAAKSKRRRDIVRCGRVVQKTVYVPQRPIHPPSPADVKAYLMSKHKHDEEQQKEKQFRHQQRSVGEGGGVSPYRGNVSEANSGMANGSVSQRASDASVIVNALLQPINKAADSSLATSDDEDGDAPTSKSEGSPKTNKRGLRSSLLPTASARDRSRGRVGSSSSVNSSSRAANRRSLRGENLLSAAKDKGAGVTEWHVGSCNLDYIIFIAAGDVVEFDAAALRSHIKHKQMKERARVSRHGTEEEESADTNTSNCQPPPIPVAYYPRGSFVGVLQAVMGSSFTRSVRCETDVVAYRIPLEKFLQFITVHPLAMTSSPQLATRRNDTAGSQQTAQKEKKRSTADDGETRPRALSFIPLEDGERKEAPKSATTTYNIEKGEEKQTEILVSAKKVSDSLEQGFDAAPSSSALGDFLSDGAAVEKGRLSPTSGSLSSSPSPLTSASSQSFVRLNGGGGTPYVTKADKHSHQQFLSTWQSFKTDLMTACRRVCRDLFLEKDLRREKRDIGKVIWERERLELQATSAPLVVSSPLLFISSRFSSAGSDDKALSDEQRRAADEHDEKVKRHAYYATRPTAYYLEREERGTNSAQQPNSVPCITSSTLSSTLGLLVRTFKTSHPLLSGLPETVINALREDTVRAVARPGDVICPDVHDSTSIFIVRRGKVSDVTTRENPPNITTAYSAALLRAREELTGYEDNNNNNNKPSVTKSTSPHHRHSLVGGLRARHRTVSGANSLHARYDSTSLKPGVLNETPPVPTNLSESPVGLGKLIGIDDLFAWDVENMRPPPSLTPQAALVLSHVQQQIRAFEESNRAAGYASSISASSASSPINLLWDKIRKLESACDLYGLTSAANASSVQNLIEAGTGSALPTAIAAKCAITKRALVANTFVEYYALPKQCLLRVLRVHSVMGVIRRTVAQHARLNAPNFLRLMQGVGRGIGGVQNTSFADNCAEANKQASFSAIPTSAMPPTTHHHVNSKKALEGSGVAELKKGEAVFGFLGTRALLAVAGAFKIKVVLPGEKIMGAPALVRTAGGRELHDLSNGGANNENAGRQQGLGTVFSDPSQPARYAVGGDRPPPALPQVGQQEGEGMLRSSAPGGGLVHTYIVGATTRFAVILLHGTLEQKFKPSSPSLAGSMGTGQENETTPTASLRSSNDQRALLRYPWSFFGFSEALTERPVQYDLVASTSAIIATISRERLLEAILMSSTLSNPRLITRALKIKAMGSALEGEEESEDDLGFDNGKERGRSHKRGGMGGGLKSVSSFSDRRGISPPSSPPPTCTINAQQREALAAQKADAIMVALAEADDPLIFQLLERAEAITNWQLTAAKKMWGPSSHPSAAVCTRKLVANTRKEAFIPAPPTSSSSTAPRAPSVPSPSNLLFAASPASLSAELNVAVATLSFAMISQKTDRRVAPSLSSVPTQSTTASVAKSKLAGALDDSKAEENAEISRRKAAERARLVSDEEKRRRLETEGEATRKKEEMCVSVLRQGEMHKKKLRDERVEDKHPAPSFAGMGDISPWGETRPKASGFALTTNPKTVVDSSAPENTADKGHDRDAINTFLSHRTESQLRLEAYIEEKVEFDRHVRSAEEEIRKRKALEAEELGIGPVALASGVHFHEKDLVPTADLLPLVTAKDGSASSQTNKRTLITRPVTIADIFNNKGGGRAFMQQQQLILGNHQAAFDGHPTKDPCPEEAIGLAAAGDSKVEPAARDSHIALLEQIVANASATSNTPRRERQLHSSQFAIITNTDTRIGMNISKTLEAQAMGNRSSSESRSAASLLNKLIIAGGPPNSSSPRRSAAQPPAFPKSNEKDAAFVAKTNQWVLAPHPPPVVLPPESFKSTSSLVFTLPNINSPRNGQQEAKYYSANGSIAVPLPPSSTPATATSGTAFGSPPPLRGVVPSSLQRVEGPRPAAPSLLLESRRRTDSVQRTINEIIEGKGHLVRSAREMYKR